MMCNEKSLIWVWVVINLLFNYNWLYVFILRLKKIPSFTLIVNYQNQFHCGMFNWKSLAFTGNIPARKIWTLIQLEIFSFFFVYDVNDILWSGTWKSHVLLEFPMNFDKIPNELSTTICLWEKLDRRWIQNDQRKRSKMRVSFLFKARNENDQIKKSYYVRNNKTVVEKISIIHETPFHNEKKIKI